MLSYSIPTVLDCYSRFFDYFKDLYWLTTFSIVLTASGKIFKMKDARGWALRSFSQTVKGHPCSIEWMYKMKPIPANIRRLSAAYIGVMQSQNWRFGCDLDPPRHRISEFLSVTMAIDAHWLNVKRRLGFCICRIKSHPFARFVLGDDQNDLHWWYSAYLDKVKGIKAQNHWKCVSWH